MWTVSRNCKNQSCGENRRLKVCWQYLAGTPKQKDLSPASMECYSSHSMGKIGCDAVLFAMGHPASKTSWYSKLVGTRLGHLRVCKPWWLMCHVWKLYNFYNSEGIHCYKHTDIHTSYSHVHIDILNIENVQGHQCDRCHHFDSCTCPAHGTIQVLKRSKQLSGHAFPDHFWMVRHIANSKHFTSSFTEAPNTWRFGLIETATINNQSTSRESRISVANDGLQFCF